MNISILHSNPSDGPIGISSEKSTTPRHTGLARCAAALLLLGLTTFSPLIPAQQIETRDYYPFIPGDTAVFSVNGTRDVVSTVSADLVPINGAEVPETAISDGSSFFMDFDDNDGMRLHRLSLPSAIEVQPGVFADLIITLDPPISALNPLATVGETINFRGSVTLEIAGVQTVPGTYSGQSRFTEIADVTVPAGTFARAIHINAAMTVSAELFGQPFVLPLPYEQWAAEAVGIVKWSANPTEVNELVASNLIASPVALSASILPTSRSVRVGSAATAFATIIAAGSETASQCRIAPLTPLSIPLPRPLEFSYQTTDPNTNQVLGVPNAPVDIEPGTFQTFVLSLTPNGALAPTQVEFAFACANSGLAGQIPGVNSLLLSGSDTDVADVIALAATLTGLGITEIPGTTGTGVFSVATVNLGIVDEIEVQADTGETALPVTLTMCETDPSTAMCINPSSPSAAPVTTTIATNATPTFAVFVTGTDNVPFDPANNRVFVNFKDSSGLTRGGTSVAVRTQ